MAQTQKTHLICSLNQSTPLQLGDHSADKLRIELHLVHLHLSGLKTNDTREETAQELQMENQNFCAVYSELFINRNGVLFTVK